MDVKRSYSRCFHGHNLHPKVTYPGCQRFFPRCGPQNWAAKPRRRVAKRREKRYSLWRSSPLASEKTSRVKVTLLCTFSPISFFFRPLKTFHFFVKLKRIICTLLLILWIFWPETIFNQHLLARCNRDNMGTSIISEGDEDGSNMWWEESQATYPTQPFSGHQTSPFSGHQMLEKKGRFIRRGFVTYSFKLLHVFHLHELSVLTMCV